MCERPPNFEDGVGRSWRFRSPGGQRCSRTPTAMLEEMNSSSQNPPTTARIQNRDSIAGKKTKWPCCAGDAAQTGDNDPREDTMSSFSWTSPGNTKGAQPPTNLVSRKRRGSDNLREVSSHKINRVSGTGQNRRGCAFSTAALRVPEPSRHAHNQKIVSAIFHPSCELTSPKNNDVSN